MATRYEINSEEFRKGPKVSAADYIFGSTYQGSQKKAYLERRDREIKRWLKRTFFPVSRPAR